MIPKPKKKKKPRCEVCNKLANYECMGCGAYLCDECSEGGLNCINNDHNLANLNNYVNSKTKEED